MYNLGPVIRALMAERVATAVAVLTLAVGIGASTAVFTVISSIVLRPLPVTEPEHLARLYLGRPSGGRLGLSRLAGDRRPLRRGVRRGVRVEPHAVRGRRGG